MTTRKLFPRHVYDEMVIHALADAPNECCGMIGFRDGVAVKLYRAENAAAKSVEGYEIAGAEQYGILMDIEEEDGLVLGAIYHSHTRGYPYPSLADIKLAYPSVMNLIVGVAGEPDVRGYWIRSGVVTEIELVVVD